VIGLLGGIGAGKTTVAELFGELGAEVVCADAIVHRLLQERRVRARLSRALASELPADDTALRRALAGRIFGCAEDRRRVEAVLHPLVDREIRRRLGQRRTGGPAAVVLDVPLLLEADMAGYCDTLVFIAAPRRERFARVRRSRNWSAAQAHARERVQRGLREKRKVSDWIIDNGKSLARTRGQVRRIWESLFPDEKATDVRRTPHAKGKDHEAEETTPRPAREAGRARRPRRTGSS
jgi:dephospho-CoA kinase